MKQTLRALCFLLTIFLVAGNGYALVLGDNITVYDGESSGSGWYGTQEDNEVHSNCLTGQEWDLEGFFLNGTTLTMVGGYDFINGQGGYASGDIFINTLGGPGYNYVFDLDVASQTYDVYALDSDSQYLGVAYNQNNDSYPWRYDADASDVALSSGSFAYYAGLSDSAVGGLAGGYHNALAVDLGFLQGSGFIAHFTMECGNDNLMGNGTAPAPVPEPATLLLMGTGLIALGKFSKRNKKA
ncbi:MAG: PEP-CTERM sorting domain-containing protein [Thermodesulfobacteriota bacterium]|nr:PEP-CTERM sorting domain-containing protein [Thermodesulfobacteriota bacterium]